jgi:hypothetical protein
VLAFLGIFFMHGATASASEEHCGGSAMSGHVHEVGHPAHGAMAGMRPSSQVANHEATRLEASIGVPSSIAPDHAGDLCVAILLAGLLAFLIHGARRAFAPAAPARGATPLRLDDSRPPPRPSLSMLSVWRH